MSWLIEESGNPEDGYSWNLFESDGVKLVMRATLYDHRFALKMKGAMDWLDSLEDFQLKLPMLPILTKTRRPVQKPKPTKSKPTVSKPRRKA